MTSQIAATVPAILLVATMGCTPSAPAAASAAESLFCPELVGSADPLELSYTSDAAADGRLRAFIAAARGLGDAAVEMERLAADSCRRMTTDLGLPETPADAPLAKRCEPIQDAIAHLAKDGIEIRVAIALPRCNDDSQRGKSCGTKCSRPGVADCDTFCKAEAAMYAQCSLPSISVSISNRGNDVMRLAHTLEQNLPSLVYAETALGKRLLTHAQNLVTISAKLPEDMKHAEPRAIACTALAVLVTGKAAARLEKVLATSSAVTALLDPELRSPGATP